MSSTKSSSSSSSRSFPRTPLHERSNLERNKLASGIRLVPYSPPRLSSDGDGESTGGSHGAATEHGRRDSYHATEDPSISSPIRRKNSHQEKDELHAPQPDSALSSPTFSNRSFAARAKGRGVSGTKLGPGSSGVGPSTPTPGLNRYSYGSNMSNSNAPADGHHDAGPTSPTPRSRRSNHIALNPDKKTFSIVLRPTNPRDSTRSSSRISSPPVSNYSTITSHDGFSFDPFDDDRSSSALSSLPERGVSPYTPASPASTSTIRADDQSASPWNYRMVGGVRKVANTPDPNDKGKDKEVAAHASIGQSPLSPLQEASSSPEPQTTSLAAKQSFNSQSSEQSVSTLDENTNVRVLAQSSPPETDSEGLPEPPSSSDSNYRVIGESSPPPPFFSSPPPGLLDTPASKNFVVHPGTSPATSSSLPATTHKPRPQYSDDSIILRDKYSQESLIVPPLNTARRKTSSDAFGYYRQKSRDTLRRANSFSSISSIISEGVASSFTGSTPNVVLLARTPSASSLQQQQPPAWAPQPSIAPPKSRMENQPHVWSSQLSTVMSEDEGSDRGSRQLSSPGLDSGSMSFGGSSRHSRQMLSIGSSLDAAEELSRASLRSHSRSRSGDYMMRGGREPSQTPAVRHIDEDGDGLADLHELHHKGSRPRLSDRLRNKSSAGSLRSSHSSRPGSMSSRHGSMTASTLPQWAKIYYGSGERKWLAAPSIRSYADDSRPASSFGRSDSPIDDQFPPNIYSQRRRPREVDPTDRPISTEVRRFSGMQNKIRKMTSSLWSPHLEEDLRARTPGMWQGPPSAAEAGSFGPRNRQVVLFALGFIFPFAWMIAAFLPLPPRVTLDVVERDHSTTQFRIPDTPEPMAGHMRFPDNKRYQSARWWRNMNRIMSVVGLLVIGAIVALAIVGYWQNMKTS